MKCSTCDSKDVDIVDTDYYEPVTVDLKLCCLECGEYSVATFELVEVNSYS